MTLRERLWQAASAFVNAGSAPTIPPVRRRGGRGRGGRHNNNRNAPLVPKEVVATRQPVTPQSNPQGAGPTPSTGSDITPLKAGRQTLPTNYSPFGLTTLSFIWRREYQSIDMSAIDPSMFEAGQLLTILADVSPDVSRALWNVLRVAGTDLSFRAKTTARGADDVAGQKLIDALLSRLNKDAGGFANLAVQMMTAAYIQGAIAMEVAPTDDLDDVEDFYPVNPNTIYYQRDQNQVPVPFQLQALWWGPFGQAPFTASNQSGYPPYRRLNTELFYYTPIDPFVDDVYGRPPAAPVLQVIFFQIQVLRDLERVLHVSGWPRIDIKVLTEVLNKNVPGDIKNNPRAYAKFVADRINEIASTYASMNPEDAFVHPDYTEVSSDTAKAGQNLFDVKSLLTVIRMQIISATKQLPILMGEHIGETETFAEVELSIFAASVDAFRLPVGDMFARAFQVALQLMGHISVVEPVWNTIKVNDRLRAAQSLQLEIMNAASERDQGWITQDQASEAVTGTKAVLPEPIPGTSAAPASAQAPPPDPKESNEGG